MSAWFFMIIAIILALAFLGMDIMTKFIGRMFDVVCEAVRRVREE